MEGSLGLLDTRAYVETPERVRFRHQLAGPGRRAIAWLIDTAIRVAALVVVATGLSVFLAIGEFVAGASTGLFLLIMFLMEWIYGVVFEVALAGRTPGKLALSLRVVRADGSPARVSDILLRNLVRGADYLPVLGAEPWAVPTFAVGILTMAIDPKLRRLGDLVGGTVVIVEDRAQVREDLVIDPPVSEEERQSLPAQVALSTEELRILEAFVRRRRRLSVERAEELAELFGPQLSERTGIEAPTWERVLVLAYARATRRDR